MSEEQAQSEPDDLEAGHKSPSASWPLQPAVLLRQMIQKITDQPFLFVIAIALLLITFALQGAQVGSGEFRFVVLVIALLAVFGMMGYYLMQLQPDLPEQKPDKPAAAPELSSASGGGSEKPALPLSSPSSPLSTAIQDIDVWVEALAQSPTMQNRDTRLAV